MTGSASFRRYWILVLVGCLALLVWATRWYLHFTNYTGLVVSPTLKVVRILSDGPSFQSGIRVGDQIVGVNGRAVANVTEYLISVQDPDLVGRTIPIDVDREGSALRFWMTIVSYPVFHVSVFGPVLGAILLIFGLYVFFKKRDDQSAELYLVLNACLFVLLALSSHVLKQTASPFLPLLWGLALIMVIPVNLHFYLVFPEPKSLLKRKPGLLAGLYILPLALAALLVWTGLRVHFAMRAGIDCTQGLDRMRSLLVATFFVGLVSCLAFAASIVHSYRRAGSPEQKKQVQILLVGAMVTLLFAGPVVYGLTLFVTGSGGAADWPSWVFPGFYGLSVLTAIFLPLCMALAILKYRLWDVDTAINRSLSYMGVSIALIVLYFFIVGVLGWLFGHVARPTSYLAVLVFTLTVALVAEPLRHLVKALVDRIFNREAYEYRKTLNTFSREMISLHRLEDLTRGLCETVSQALDVRSILVVLKEGGLSRTYRVAASEGPPQEVWLNLLQGSGAVADLVKSHHGPFAPVDLEVSPDVAEEETRTLTSMREARTSLVVPIHKEEELLGWISLGEKRSDALYSSEDRDLLETLANQAAMAITNALAFEEIDGLNRDLRRKMAKVEEQRSEILQLQERLLDENRYLKEEIERQYDFTEIVGATHGLKQVMATVEKAAASDATILVCGESGTGKELVARAIHFNSHLREGPFIKVNCAALSEGLLQSELFGHEKGAFTGAHERRTGRFELADGGTIFLDEIGDIPASTQVLLLRVLQEQEFERVGGSEPIKVRVRVIAATNRNLEALVAEDRFRTDLYYRLKVITIEVPPLRERQSDILELSLHFVSKYAQKYGKRILKLDDPVVEHLKRYDWPGNVRELENIIERAVVLSRGESLSLGEIPMELKTTESSGSPVESLEMGQKQAGTHAEVISEIERQRLIEALEKARGNKSEAARSLGLKRSTFFNKLKRYGLLAEKG